MRLLPRQLTLSLILYIDSLSHFVLLGSKTVQVVYRYFVILSPIHYHLNVKVSRDNQIGPVSYAPRRLSVRSKAEGPCDHR